MSFLWDFFFKGIVCCNHWSISTSDLGKGKQSIGIWGSSGNNVENFFLTQAGKCSHYKCSNSWSPHVSKQLFRSLSQQKQFCRNKTKRGVARYSTWVLRVMNQNPVSTTGCDGTHLQPWHSGVWRRGITNSRSAWATQWEPISKSGRERKKEKNSVSTLAWIFTLPECSHQQPYF